jgi:excisionase family DNA binding protein
MADIILHSTPVIEIRNLIREEMRKELKEFFGKKSVKSPTQGKYLTRIQTATSLNISLPTLRKWTIEGKLKAYQLGRRVLYKPEEVENALREQIKYSRK